MTTLWISLGIMAGYMIVLLWAVSRLVESGSRQKIVGIVKIVPIETGKPVSIDSLPLLHAETQIDLDRVDC